MDNKLTLLIFINVNRMDNKLSLIIFISVNWMCQKIKIPTPVSIPLSKNFISHISALISHVTFKSA